MILDEVTHRLVNRVKNQAVKKVKILIKETSRAILGFDKETPRAASERSAPPESPQKAESPKSDGSDTSKPLIPD